MALPSVNTKLAKKKLDPMDDLVEARMSVKPATSATAVNEVAKPMADAARQGKAGTVETSPRPTSGKDPMDDLVDARSATEAEIDASNAKQQMDARSRAGLGGLGLSGGAQAGAADLARQQARTKALTMADFDKMMADQKFTDIQREAVTDDVELAADFDYNDDGMIGGEKVGGKIGDRDPENDPDKKPADAEDAKRALDEAKAMLPVSDLYTGDPGDGSGGRREEPYSFDAMADFVKWFRETTGMDPDVTLDDYGQYSDRIVFKDQFGNWYSILKRG